MTRLRDIPSVFASKFKRLKVRKGGRSYAGKGAPFWKTIAIRY